MEKLAKILASRVAASLSYDGEKEAVIAYGLFAILQISLTIVLIIVFGLFFGTVIEGLLVCLSASILRKYSGGVHAIAAELCTTMSILYCTLAAIISKRLFAAIYKPEIIAVVIVLVYVLAYMIVFLKAPVDSPNKPIKTDKKIKRMRKGSFIIITVYLCLSAAMFLLSYRYSVFKSYGISFIFGIAWQIFTLTSPAFKLIGSINRFYTLLRKEV